MIASTAVFDRSETLVQVLNLAADMTPDELYVFRGIAEAVLETSPMPSDGEPETTATSNAREAAAQRIASELETSLLVLGTVVARLRRREPN